MSFIPHWLLSFIWLPDPTTWLFATVVAAIVVLIASKWIALGILGALIYVLFRF